MLSNAPNFSRMSITVIRFLAVPLLFLSRFRLCMKFTVYGAHLPSSNFMWKMVTVTTRVTKNWPIWWNSWVDLLSENNAYKSLRPETPPHFTYWVIFFVQYSKLSFGYFCSHLITQNLALDIVIFQILTSFKNLIHW